MKTKILRNGSPVANWDTDTMEIDTQDKALIFFRDHGVFTRTGGQTKDGTYYSGFDPVEPSDEKFLQAFYDVITFNGYSLPLADAKQLTDQFIKKKTKEG
jgi:hypothetical protein